MSPELLKAHKRKQQMMSVMQQAAASYCRAGRSNEASRLVVLKKWRGCFAEACREYENVRNRENGDI